MKLFGRVFGHLSEWMSVPSVVLAFALLPFSMESHAAACERPVQLRFSMVPQNDMQKELTAFEPLFEELQAALGMPVEVVMPSSYGAVIEGLLSSNVDLARLGPASYVTARRQDASLTPFASIARLVDGDEQSFYYSYLIAYGDKPRSVQSLRGKKLSLVDPDSTSGALIPRHIFSRSIKKPIDQYFGRINYAGSHDQAIANVVAKQVDAAFVSSTAFNAYQKNAGDKASGLQILWKSMPVPRDPFVLREALCPDLKRKIKAVFLRQDGAANKDVLKRLGIQRFVSVSDADYQIVRELP